MIQIFKPKAKRDPVLFQVSITFHPLNERALDKGTYKLTDSGEAFSGIKKLGKVDKKIWNYVKSVGTSFDLIHDQYGYFLIAVHGDPDTTLVSPIQGGGQEYTYNCGDPDPIPPMLPSTEYLCDLVEQEDHLDIMLDNKKIGELAGDDERVRRAKIMLHKGFKATCQLELKLNNAWLYVVLRRQI